MATNTNFNFKTTRQDGLNIFKFRVSDPEQAFLAVLDVAQLYSIGHGARYPGERPINWRNCLEAFFVCGFPCTTGGYNKIPELTGGVPGAQGAAYECRFPVDKKGKGRMSWKTEIVEIRREPRRKEAVFRHTQNPHGEVQVDFACLPHPEIPAETETRIRISENDRGEWRCKVIFTGMNAFDPTAREGVSNYIALTCLVAPICLPCLPFFICGEFTQPPESVRAIMKRLHEYIDGYRVSAVPAIRYHDRNESSRSSGARTRDDDGKGKSVPQGIIVGEDHATKRTNYDMIIPVARELHEDI